MRITVHATAKPGRPRLALALALVLFGASLVIAAVVIHLRHNPPRESRELTPQGASG